VDAVYNFWDRNPVTISYRYLASNGSERSRFRRHTAQPLYLPPLPKAARGTGSPLSSCCPIEKSKGGGTDDEHETRLTGDLPLRLRAASDQLPNRGAMARTRTAHDQRAGARCLGALMVKWRAWHSDAE
jgi:hypothetical protein